MTDTKLLREKINSAGLKIVWIAEQCNLSYQGLLNKINNKTDFTAPEIVMLKEILKLSASDVEDIFFAMHVENYSTKKRGE